MISAAFLLLLALLLAVSPSFAGEASNLAHEARQLAQSGQHDKAIEKAEDALAAALKEGGERQPLVAYIHNELATLYLKISPRQALVHAERAVGLGELLLEANSAELSTLRINYAGVLTHGGDYREAESQYLIAYKALGNKLKTQSALALQVAKNLALVYVELNQYEESEYYLDQALALAKELSATPRETLFSLHRQKAELALNQGNQKDFDKHIASASRYLSENKTSKAEEQAKLNLTKAKFELNASNLDEAQQILQNTLANLESLDKRDSLVSYECRHALGNIYLLRGSAVEAEQLFQSSLEGFRRVIGAKHPAVGRTLHSLARVYKQLGEYKLSERHYLSALKIFDKTLQTGSVPEGRTRLEYALMLVDAKRPGEAETQARKAVSIFENKGKEFDIEKGYASSALGFSLFDSHNFDAAEASFIKAINLMRAARGKYSADLPPGLMKLAQINLKKGNTKRAKKFLASATKIQRRNQATGPRALPQALSLLSQTELFAGNSRKALNHAKEAVETLAQRLAVSQGSHGEFSLGEQRKWRSIYENYLDIASTTGGDKGESFIVAQYPHLTGTAAAISNMIARFIPDDPALASLVREKQAKLEHWQRKQSLLVAQLKSSAAPLEKLNKLRDELDAIEGEIEILDAKLESLNAYDQYQQLANPTPVDASEMKSLLAPEEALLVQVTGKEQSHFLLLTTNDLFTATTDMSADELWSLVERLRSAVDLRQGSRSFDRFPADDAHALFKQIFEPFTPQLGNFGDFASQKIKHLFFVPDRAMQNLSPALLVAKPPQKNDPYQDLAFLPKYLAVSVLPSVSALKALRENRKTPKSQKPLVGFGAPEFQGANSESTRGLVRKVVQSMKREVKPSLLKKMMKALPESEAEVRSIAQMLNANANDLFFGRAASEETVKKLPLDDYRYITFATHALMSGEFAGIVEPSIALSPPPSASELDDGLLMASEIADLKLDADWVLLSACNTASAGKDTQGAEGLSGLARSFFYAGARSLLVSHWWVSSKATVQLTTATVGNLTQNEEIGRAEALRRAMVQMIDDPKSSHPALWAPFVVVGEGGTG